MKIGVIGCGYVGLSNASVWANKYEVGLWDKDLEKLKKIQKGIVPFKDKFLEKNIDVLCNRFVTYDTFEEFVDSNYVFLVAVPTDINEEIRGFDTAGLEQVVKDIVTRKRKKGESDYSIIIKSTIPIGFIDKAKMMCDCDNVLYIPEFLREGTAYYDCIYPQRIIVGGISDGIRQIINQYMEIIFKLGNKKNITVLFVSIKEAEAIKLFSNAYLAMRVAFFNEVDTLAESEGLNTKKVIDGICGDSRIGYYYNNPSFGYGGYCLPKDTKNLAWFSDSLHLIRAVIDSNEARKKRIATKIIHSQKSVGVYKLNMKYNSDNLRGSALLDIIKILLEDNVFAAICDPDNEEIIKDKLQVSWVSTLEELDEKCDIILSNRIYPELCRYIDKVYTRDIFERD